MEKLKDNVFEQIKDCNEKVGLVLGGGGAKGCYEIGALQAFKECGIAFDCVAGTSIGAIVGAIYAAGSADNFVDFVIDMKPTDIVEDLVIPNNFREAVAGREHMLKLAEHYKKAAGFDTTPLHNKFKEMFDYDSFEKSPINYACMTYNFTQLKGIPWFKNQGINRDNVEDVVMASASCFPAFPMLPIDGDLYIDGGYEDNLPVSLALQMHAEKIVAIDVKGVGLYKPKIESDSIVYWEPSVSLGNILDFRAKEGMRSMQLGYLDTMRRLDQMPGFIYTFDKQDFRQMIDFENFLQINLQNDVQVSKSVKKKFLGKDVPDIRSKFTRVFLYEIVLEYLGLAANMDPSHIYRFDEFLNELHMRLKEKRFDSIEDFNMNDLVDTGVIEIIRLFYKKGNLVISRLPKRLQEIDFIEDLLALAYVWKGLDTYLNK